MRPLRRSPVPLAHSAACPQAEAGGDPRGDEAGCAGAHRQAGGHCRQDPCQTDGAPGGLCNDCTGASGQGSGGAGPKSARQVRGPSGGTEAGRRRIEAEENSQGVSADEVVGLFSGARSGEGGRGETAAPGTASSAAGKVRPAWVRVDLQVEGGPLHHADEVHLVGHQGLLIRSCMRRQDWSAGASPLREGLIRSGRDVRHLDLMRPMLGFGGHSPGCRRERPGCGDDAGDRRHEEDHGQLDRRGLHPEQEGARRRDQAGGARPTQERAQAPPGGRRRCGRGGCRRGSSSRRLRTGGCPDGARCRLADGACRCAGVPGGRVAAPPQGAQQPGIAAEQAKEGASGAQAGSSAGRGRRRCARAGRCR
mmetsp:Transcript_53454/g.153369  ORF Transcript_53454/g.153369 Transcript_53454/m.153369 type:complete len:365 (-) Transcript_53454:508-1602(-)